ncbi:hypothetical protein BKA93DRAFT_738395, partial [Sparassis latifolia]
SCKAFSTDMEHSFSNGHHKVNFMQHNVSLQTFKTLIVVSSWDNAPLMPKFSG